MTTGIGPSESWEQAPLSSQGSLNETSAERHVVVAPGIRTPYPEPGSAAATAIGKANRRTNTKPELQLRSALHRRGLRFRKDHRLQAGGLKVRVDVAFTRRRIAVFVDGCFWHGCPEHQNTPNRNREYWVPKLAANRARDHRVNAALQAEGWEVVRIWEHEGPERAADRINDLVRSR